jgi:hypothetical protein
MAWFQKDKERERFYLFPGMGGRAARRKHQRFLQWSIAVGLLVGTGVGVVLYYLNVNGN